MLGISLKFFISKSLYKNLLLFITTHIKSSFVLFAILVTICLKSPLPVFSSYIEILFSFIKVFVFCIIILFIGFCIRQLSIFIIL